MHGDNTSRQANGNKLQNTNQYLILQEMAKFLYISVVLLAWLAIVSSRPSNKKDDEDKHRLKDMEKKMVSRVKYADEKNDIQTHSPPEKLDEASKKMEKSTPSLVKDEPKKAKEDILPDKSNEDGIKKEKDSEVVFALVASKDVEGLKPEDIYPGRISDPEDEDLTVRNMPIIYSGMVREGDSYSVPIVLPIGDYGAMSFLPLPPDEVSDRLPIIGDPIIAGEPDVDFEIDDEEEDHESLEPEDKKVTYQLGSPLALKLTFPFWPLQTILKEVENVVARMSKSIIEEDDGIKPLNKTKSEVVDLMGKRFILKTNIARAPSRLNDMGRIYVRVVSLMPLGNYSDLVEENEKSLVMKEEEEKKEITKMAEQEKTPEENVKILKAEESEKPKDEPKGLNVKDFVETTMEKDLDMSEQRSTKQEIKPKIGKDMDESKLTFPLMEESENFKEAKPIPATFKEEIASEIMKKMDDSEMKEKQIREEKMLNFPKEIAMETRNLGVFSEHKSTQDHISMDKEKKDMKDKALNEDRNKDMEITKIKAKVEITEKKDAKIAKGKKTCKCEIDETSEDSTSKED